MSWSRMCAFESVLQTKRIDHRNMRSIMMNIYKKSLSVLVATLLSFQVNAATVACTGTVEELSYHASNQLMIRLSSMNTPVYICNPSSEWVVPGTAYRTSAETCRVLYSTFLTARVSGIPIRNLYFDGDDVPATCDTWGSWKSANIRHYKF